MHAPSRWFGGDPGGLDIVAAGAGPIGSGRYRGARGAPSERGVHAEPRKRESGTGGMAPLFLAGPKEDSGLQNSRAAVTARQEFFSPETALAGPAKVRNGDKTVDLKAEAGKTYRFDAALTEK
jgi:hypothetical protein